MVNFNPTTDIPSLTNKVILITGANTGLGLQSALQLAHHNPSEIWLTSRSLSKAQAAADQIRSQIPDANLKALQLDLASLESVKRAAAEFLSQAKRLDILMLNAGIMADPASLTQEGYEIQFGTNHLGHAALVKLLLPVLQTTPNARVVTLSSMGHKYIPRGGIVFDSLKTPAPEMATNDRYGQSKLANILFASELARRCPGMTSVSVHPGIVKTDLFGNAEDGILAKTFVKCVLLFVGVSVEQGAWNQLWAATAEGVESGEYYTPVGVKGGGNALSRDEELARRLWEWTEAELVKHGI